MLEGGDRSESRVGCSRACSKTVQTVEVFIFGLNRRTLRGAFSLTERMHDGEGVGPGIEAKQRARGCAVEIAVQGCQGQASGLGRRSRVEIPQNVVRGARGVYHEDRPQVVGTSRRGSSIESSMRVPAPPSMKMGARCYVLRRAALRVRAGNHSGFEPAVESALGGCSHPTLLSPSGAAVPRRMNARERTSYLVCKSPPQRRRKETYESNTSSLRRHRHT